MPSALLKKKTLLNQSSSRKELNMTSLEPSRQTEASYQQYMTPREENHKSLFSENSTMFQKSLIKGGGKHSQTFIKNLIEGKNKELRVSLNKDCLACSGQSATILKAFKIACLSYKSSNIIYREEEFTRDGLIKLNGQMLNSIWQKLKSGHPWLLKGGDSVNNTTIAYDYKDLLVEDQGSPHRQK